MMTIFKCALCFYFNLDYFSYHTHLIFNTNNVKNNNKLVKVVMRKKNRSNSSLFPYCDVQPSKMNY